MHDPDDALPEPTGSASAADESAARPIDHVPDDGLEADTDEEEGADSVLPRESYGARRAFSLVGRVLAVVLVIVIAMTWWPVSTSGLDDRPDRTGSYDDAVDRFDTITADEDGVVFDPCRSQLLTHDAPTDVVVVLYHGLTNCPEQFLELGTNLFDDGANVLILRAPGHGRANASDNAIGSVSNAGSLTAEKLRDYADDSMDIATGLGDEVRVMGLSMGGVLAAWTAQFRKDADRVVVLAPAINIPGTPSIATTAFMNLFSKVPNASLPGRSKLDHAYSGESTRGLAAMFTLARAMQDNSHTEPAKAGEVIVVINPDDDQVDADEVAGFANRWSQLSDNITVHELPAVGLPHDVIDEDQPAGNPELVYPILIALLDGETP